nr:reverse transcriptase domain-containing protein [Tanacetum cinerariifolium]
EPWTLFIDGSSCVDGSGAGLILTSPEGVEFTYALRFQFTTSNNEAEYEALFLLLSSLAVQTSGSGISYLLAVATIFTGSDTPFSLTYGTEAVIPTEIGMPTYRIAAADMVNNDKDLHLNQDLLEERRERVAICEAKDESKMMKYYKARVRGVAFKLSDFVYRSNDASHAVASGKLGPKWEGPYEVIEALGNRAYKLRFMDGTILLRT